MVPLEHKLVSTHFPLQCCPFPLHQISIYHDLNAIEPPETVFTSVDVSWPTPSCYVITGKILHSSRKNNNRTFNMFEKSKVFGEVQLSSKFRLNDYAKPCWTQDVLVIEGMSACWDYISQQHSEEKPGLNSGLELQNVYFGLKNIQGNQTNPNLYKRPWKTSHKCQKTQTFYCTTSLVHHLPLNVSFSDSEHLISGRGVHGLVE